MSSTIQNVPSSGYLTSNTKTQYNMPQNVNHASAAASNHSFEPLPYLKGTIPSLPIIKVDLSSPYEYTKEDALQVKNRKTLVIDDADLLKLNMKRDPIEFEASLREREDGLCNSSDFMYAGLDMAHTAANIDQLTKSIDCLASRYAALTERVNTDLSGERKESNLNRADELLNTYKNKLADNFADSISKILEDNGVSGEREIFRQSVMNEIDKKVEQYTDFVQNHPDYAGVNSAEESWLLRDTAYTASQLRKAFAAEHVPEVQDASAPEAYSLEELEKMQSFAYELSSYTQESSDWPEAIHTGNESEESLGMKLAELKIKGTVFNEYSGVSDRLKDIVTKSINHVIENAIRKENEYMKKWAALQIQAQEELVTEGHHSRADANQAIREIQKNFTPVDEAAIYAVIQKVENTYQQTGNARKALLFGAVSAQTAYNKKSEDSRFQGMDRYSGYSAYWNNFFVNQEKYRGTDIYIQKMSSLDTITDSWNRFMSKVTDNGKAYLNQEQFTARV